MSKSRAEIEALRGGSRRWFDSREQRWISAETLYLPQGCPDWGERDGARNELCAFCSLPNSVAEYRQEFFEGRPVPTAVQLAYFLENLSKVPADAHTLMIFNAGSFLADKANPLDLRVAIVEAVAAHPSVRRLVVESRAELITVAALQPLQAILADAGKQLTIRVGVETQDDKLRLQVLRKGHSRRQLHAATEVMRSMNVTSGAYVLLNPAPGLEQDWAVDETEATINWVLDDLGFSEAYFAATCVSLGSPLMKAWERGEFRPATLAMVWKVLQEVVPRHGSKVRLLPFEDHPAFVAVPSNHVLSGIPESLDGAMGCDKEFHKVLQRFRDTLSLEGLAAPQCDCAR